MKYIWNPAFRGAHHENHLESQHFTVSSTKIIWNPAFRGAHHEIHPESTFDRIKEHGTIFRRCPSTIHGEGKGQIQSPFAAYLSAF